MKISVSLEVWGEKGDGYMVRVDVLVFFIVKTCAVYRVSYLF